MIDFSIVGKIDFKTKPDWLDEFRARYDRPIPWHITLKNSTYLEKRTESEVAELLRSMAEGFRPINLNFKNISKSLTSTGWCLILDVTSDSEFEYLKVVQTKILEAFREYGSTIKNSYAEYEKNFKPHLTIANGLDLTRLNKALEEISSKESIVYCECEINTLQLIFAEVETGVEVNSSRRFIDFQIKK